MAEVKPHFGCQSGAGPDRVRGYIDGLVERRYGIITLLQVEFPVRLPSGYTPIGAACGQTLIDGAVVFIRDDLFRIVQPLGDTLVGHGNYSSMPFVANGTEIGGSMCVADIAASGTRVYAGAELEHIASGTRLCLLAGTLPHPELRGEPYAAEFLEQVAKCSQDKPLLCIADTNLAGEETLEELVNSRGADLRRCSDPGRWAPPTCCDDSAWGHPEPRYKSDRTAICGGGTVTKFHVEPVYICKSAEEHRFTVATVELPARAPAEATAAEATAAPAGAAASGGIFAVTAAASAALVVALAVACVRAFIRRWPVTTAREPLLAAEQC